MKVNIKKTHENAKIPVYKTSESAGCDVTSVEEVRIKPGESLLVRTGISLEIPKGYLVMLVPRSSFALKKNLDIPNSVGIGDSDFRGEYMFAIRNLGTEDAIIEKDERMGQLVFFKYEQAEFEEKMELENSERGVGGFGSTGKF